MNSINKKTTGAHVSFFMCLSDFFLKQVFAFSDNKIEDTKSLQCWLDSQSNADILDVSEESPAQSKYDF